MRFQAIIIAGVMLASAAVPATAATTLLSDGFEAENGGVGQLFYFAYENFFSGGQGNGNTDLIRSGDFGITCAGGSNMCVDLDGSFFNNGGRLQTRVNSNDFSISAGDRVTFSFEVSGNQRIGPDDALFAGIRAYESPQNVATLLDVQTGGAFGTTNLGDLPGVTGFQVDTIVPFGAPFATYTLSFTAFNDLFFNAFVGTPIAGSDAAGPTLDNVLVTVQPATGAVPEPASWAMLIAGFGLVGATARRRRAAVAA